MHEEIGPALRQARLDRNLSLRGLAAEAGISASQLPDRDRQVQPSVSTLYALVAHLEVSLDELLGIGKARTGNVKSTATGPVSPVRSESPGVVQRAADNPVLEMANGVRWERLALDPGTDADALLVTYEPARSARSIEC